MDGFSDAARAYEGNALTAYAIDILQINVGRRCNQNCMHCHLESSPDSVEQMEWRTMKAILNATQDRRFALVDITGGAPELNPHLCEFIACLREQGHLVQLRTNLSVMLEPGMLAMPQFLRDHEVQLAASLPCYLRENVDRQRGRGAYDRSIRAIQHLNRLGYGVQPQLALNLVFNPAGASLPPDQARLEADYRRELSLRFGISFTHLYVIANMPLGRFLAQLRNDKSELDYMHLLRSSFNPNTLDGLMCRRQVSVGWDGTLYDCDFNLALGLPIEVDGIQAKIESFDPNGLVSREIVTGEHCFACTAGCGSSCSGELASQG